MFDDRNLEDFINNIDSFSSVSSGFDVKPWQFKDKYTVKLIKAEIKKSRSNDDMLVLTFRELDSRRLVSEYICFGHTNPKVKNIAAAKLKKFLACAKTKKINDVINFKFEVKIKADNQEKPAMFNITEFLSCTNDDVNNSEDIPF